MIQKDEKDYGLKVGYLYFLNTLGTFFGAVGLGYLAFYIFELQAIYWLSLGLLLALGVYFLKSRWLLQGLVMALVVTSTYLPFSRKYHKAGLFRERHPSAIEHFKGLFGHTNKPHQKYTKYLFQRWP